MTMVGGWFVPSLLVSVVIDASSTMVSNMSSHEVQFQNALKTVASLCQIHSSTGCMQLDLLTQLERLSSTTDLQVLPGVFLSHNLSAASTAPEPPPLAPLARDLDTATRTINKLLVDRSLHHLRTWTLSVPVFGNDTLQQFQNVLENSLYDQGDGVTGRKTKYWKWMGTALLTTAFSILSALVSKALTLSVVALALTLIRGAAGFGFGASTASSPAVAYRAPPPALRTHLAHTSEVQYLDDQEDGQPLVYVNKRNWKVARSDQDYDNYYNKYYYS